MSVAESSIWYALNSVKYDSSRHSIRTTPACMQCVNVAAVMSAANVKLMARELTLSRICDMFSSPNMYTTALAQINANRVFISPPPVIMFGIRFHNPIVDSAGAGLGANIHATIMMNTTV